MGRSEGSSDRMVFTGGTATWRLCYQEDSRGQGRAGRQEATVRRLEGMGVEGRGDGGEMK